MRTTRIKPLLLAVLGATFARAIQQRISLAFLVLSFVALSGCCEEEVPQVYRTNFDFDKPTKGVELIPTDSIAVDRTPSALGTKIETSFMRGRVAGDDWGFNLGLSSTSSQPVRILWTQASYTDELGRTHPLLVYSGGGLPRPDDPLEDVTLRNDKEIMFAVTVKDKVKKLRTSCRSWTSQQEPIVPWEQRENPYVTRDEVARSPERVISSSTSSRSSTLVSGRRSAWSSASKRERPRESGLRWDCTKSDTRDVHMETSFVKRFLLRAFPTFLAMTLGCGAPKPPCRPFEVSDAYMLLPTSASLGEVSAAELSPTGCADFDGLLLCVRASPVGCATFPDFTACSSSDGRFITVRVKNGEAASRIIDWGNAILVDEEGRSHRLAQYPDPFEPQERLEPAANGRIQKLIPEEKRTYRESGGLPYQAIEQFIPWTSDRCRTRPAVDRHFEEQRHVTLVVPILTERETASIKFDLVLEKLSRKEFHRRLNEHDF